MIPDRVGMIVTVRRKSAGKTTQLCAPKGAKTGHTLEVIYLKVRGVMVDLDIVQYLESHGLRKVQVAGSNVMACCPFHEERKPSFGVSLETGVYHCFGCGARGSFGHLVKHLTGSDTVFDAEEYLIGLYGRYSANPDESFELSFNETQRPPQYWIPDDTLRRYRHRHPYLGQRGITEEWQRRFEIGYDRDKRAVTFPWRDERGRLLTVKFRQVATKAFWYEPAMPSRIKSQTLYGLDKVLKWRPRHVAITEAEIDCLSVWQAGMVGAIAIGGNQLTDAQAKKLIRYLTPDTEIVVFTDNDAGGDVAKQLITRHLSGHFKITQVNWSLAAGAPKDANDLETNQVRTLLTQREPVPLSLAI